jgi:adenylate cyclase
MKLTDDKRIEISDWLIESALAELSIEETICSFAEKMTSVGLPVHRINCSSNQRYQIMGAVDYTWDNDSGESKTVYIPKSTMIKPKNSETAVGAMAKSASNFERYNLNNSDTRIKFTTFEKLHTRGYSDYVLLKKTYGRQWDFVDFNPDSEAAYGSFAIKQMGGFSDAQIDGIKSLWAPFSLFVKTTIERMLSAMLLEAYVGRLPARNILSGQIERGDGNKINCVLWYSDLRGSTQLSTNLPTDKYLELLNDYFDCTAGSAIENGGEVLKFIGNGVMEIFPFDESEESKSNSCLSALSAARLSLSNAKKLQTANKTGGEANINFGIGLHVGEVILGNVGTKERLDMTVTGSAVKIRVRIDFANNISVMDDRCRIEKKSRIFVGLFLMMVHHFEQGFGIYRLCFRR